MLFAILAVNNGTQSQVKIAVTEFWLLLFYCHGNFISINVAKMISY